jgi:hypothetical protein
MEQLTDEMETFILTSTTEEKREKVKELKKKLYDKEQALKERMDNASAIVQATFASRKGVLAREQHEKHVRSLVQLDEVTVRYAKACCYLFMCTDLTRRSIKRPETP